MTEEALGNVDLAGLLFDGAKADAEVLAACQSADVERTIEGASTLTIGLRDTHRTLLRSGILSSRTTTQIDRFSFELAQVKKTGHNLSCTFEDLAVAALRQDDAPRKVAPGTTTRVGFARLLIGEAPGVELYAPVPGAPTKIEIGRGKFATKDSVEEREDTWAALGRLADEVAWRRFVRDGKVWFVPETWLYAQKAVYRLSEDSPGVEWIDFDFDSGKPVATVSMTVRAERWAAPPGSAIELFDSGPANGKWIVSSIGRSLFKTSAGVRLVKPRPVLPEPVPPPPPDPSETRDEGKPGGNAGEGSMVTPGPVSAQGFSWPLKGRVSSGYGTRNGRLHAGLDISVSVGTAVGAAKAGTVTFAGDMGGYGSIVIVNHGGTFTRYAHLSRRDVRRGQQVGIGERLGVSGGARGAAGSGNSSGPHLHFEIRPGDRPADPRKYLP